MELIKCVFSACLCTLAVLLLIIIGAGGMLLDLLGAAASALICIAITEIYIHKMEDPDDE